MRIEVGCRKGTTVLISAYQDYFKTIDDASLVSMERWDEAEAQIETAELLFKDGVSLRRVRHSSVEIGHSYNVNSMSFETLRRLKKVHGNHEFVTVFRVFYDDEGNEERREEIEAIISKLPAFEKMNSNATIDVNFLALNPWKTIFLGGSNVAETEKEL